MDFKEYETKAKGLKEEWTKESYENYKTYVGPIDNSNPLHNNDVDAYRHAYVAAKLTQLMAGTQWAAEVILDAHEVSSKNAPYEHRMDAWNNEVGRRFGDEYSSKELGQKLAEELKPGGLLVTTPNDSRLETLYPNDQKLKDTKLIDRNKDGEWGVSEKEMDKITDDASKEIDRLIEVREDKLENASKEALLDFTVVNDKDIVQPQTIDTTLKAQELVASMNLSRGNDGNQSVMEIGD